MSRETCQSGLSYFFAKEVGFNRPREFESRRLREYKNEHLFRCFFCSRRRAKHLNTLRVRFETLLPYLRVILIRSKWERGTAHVMREILAVSVNNSFVF